MSNPYKLKLRSAARAKAEEERLRQQAQVNSPSADGSNEQTHDSTLLPSPQTPPMPDLPVEESDDEEEDDGNLRHGQNELMGLEALFPPSPYGRRKHQLQGDRAIPSRDSDFARNFHLMEGPSSSSRNPYIDPDYHTESHNHYRRLSAYYRAELLGDTTAADDFTSSESSSRTPQRVFSYSRGHRERSPHRPHGYDTPTRISYQTSPISEAGLRILAAHQNPPRRISRTAIKILDAPELQDDFYLNLVDWGANDCLAVGLGTCVYLWNANTSNVTKLCDLVNDSITSVGWAQYGSHLAIGTNKGHVLLYDTEVSRRVRTWTGHTGRSGSLAWSSNILSSGSRDHRILHRDVRSPQQYFRELTRHMQEVCGLKWNREGTMLASGGNDNNLLVWDGHQDRLLWKFSRHTAAVKAIAWSPRERGALVSGGGTADKTIKYWNALSGRMELSYETGSQVCNLIWSKRTDEVVSTHGYASNSDSSSNQVIVWKAKTAQRVATLTGHSSRVLYMSMNRDGSTIVTGAGDETLRFWDIFSSVEPRRREPENRVQNLR